jgi:hypothetical protein
MERCTKGRRRPLGKGRRRPTHLEALEVDQGLKGLLGLKH